MFKRLFYIGLLGMVVLAVVPVMAEQMEITVLENVLEGLEPEEIVAEFEALYPQIKVNLVQSPDMNLQETLTTWLLGGIAPDIFVGWRAFPIEWALNGFLLELDPYIEKYMTDEDIAEYAPAQYQFINVQGKQYGIPKYMGTVATYYNRRLFAEAGIPEPTRDTWTWETLRNTAMKLTVRDGMEIKRYGFFTLYDYDRINYWIRQGGGYIQRPDRPNEVAINEPEALAALEFLYRLAHEDQVYLIDWWPADEKFAGEHLVIWEEGVWSLKRICDTGMDPSHIGICELAVGPGGRASLVNNDVFVVNSGAKHPEAAFLFLRFITSPEINARRAQSGLVPATRSTAGSWIQYAADTFKLPAQHLMSFIYAADYAYTAPIFNNQGLVDQYFKEICDRIFVFGESPTGVINSVISALNAIVK